MSSVKAYVNPGMLIWARNTANYDIDEICHKMDIPIEKMESWENGEETPTYNQLLDLANYYKRPSTLFFGNNVPKIPKKKPNFRFLPNSEQLVDRLTPNIEFELRDAEVRRDIAINLKEELGEEIFPYPLKCELNESPKIVAEKVRNTLNIRWPQQASWKTPDDALKVWISKIQNLDVLIFQFSGIKIEEMRGYAISKDLLPIIGINGKEHPHGKIFSLIHELIHITLRKEGISNLNGYIISNNIEYFCNMVAGEILVPEDIILKHKYVVDSDGTWKDYQIRALSKRFKVSREVILRRLLTLEKISTEFYNSEREELINYIAPPLKDPSKKSGGGGDLRGVLSLRNNGSYYTKTVLNSYKDGIITTSEVSDYLGVKLRYLPEIEQRLYK